jgi:hypothetical protein
LAPNRGSLQKPIEGYHTPSLHALKKEGKHQPKASPKPHKKTEKSPAVTKNSQFVFHSLTQHLSLP